jgi:hypothetical protein
VICWPLGQSSCSAGLLLNLYYVKLITLVFCCCACLSFDVIFLLFVVVCHLVSRATTSGSYRGAYILRHWHFTINKAIWCNRKYRELSHYWNAFGVVIASYRFYATWLNRRQTNLQNSSCWEMSHCTASAANAAENEDEEVDRGSFVWSYKWMLKSERRHHYWVFLKKNFHLSSWEATSNRNTLILKQNQSSNSSRRELICNDLKRARSSQ